MEDVLLASELRVRFRAVTPSEKQKLAEGFARLSAESRYRQAHPRAARHAGQAAVSDAARVYRRGGLVEFLRSRRSLPFRIAPRVRGVALSARRFVK